jgi:hypothetical protein
VAANPVVLESSPLISEDEVLEAPPLNPVPEGDNQVYLVLFGITPSTPSVGVSTNGTPPHTVTEAVWI